MLGATGMPLPGLQLVSEGRNIYSVEAITDHIAVFRARGSTWIVPLQALSSEDVMNAANYTYPRAPDHIFVLDDCTLFLLDNEPGSITWIHAAGPDFKQATTQDLALHEFDGYYIGELRRLQTAQTSEPTALLGIVLFNDTEYKDEEVYATLTVTRTTAEISDVNVIYDDDQPLEEIHKAGIFVEAGYTINNMKNAIYLNTGSFLMCWIPHRDNMGDIIFDIVANRWILRSYIVRRYTRKIEIYDLATRSGTPVQEYETDTNTATVTWPPSAAVTPNRTLGILVLLNRLYRFTPTAYVQPLEVLSAMATFNQLSEKKRKAINAEGSFNYETFIRVCCSE